MFRLNNENIQSVLSVCFSNFNSNDQRKSPETIMAEFRIAITTEFNSLNRLFCTSDLTTSKHFLIFANNWCQPFNNEKFWKIYRKLNIN